MCNAEKYLIRCLKSIQNQSYKNLEIILINDGSKDKTSTIAHYYESSDDRIIVIDKENNGVSSARNFGLKIATGDYITFIDIDDYVELDYIDRFVNESEIKKVDLVIGGLRQVRGKKNRILTNKAKGIKLEGKKNIHPLICAILDVKSDIKGNYNPLILGFPFAKMYKRELLLNIQFKENIPIREDAIFNMEVMLKARSIGIFDYVGYHYLLSPDSATGKFRENFSEEVTIFLKTSKNTWLKNDLPINSYYTGVLYTYMNWLKICILNDNSTFTFSERRKMIKESFKNEMWKKSFLSLEYKGLTKPYQTLQFFFRKKSSIGIIVLYKISEFLKRM
jgi:glycosyltransferase involved in cell wall biosynthesis